jgi:drug/metabolite transporter (DMT)-like permease
LFGLLAAACWGVADVLGAVVSRRIGSFASVVVGQTAGLIAVGVVALVSAPRIPELTLSLLWLPASGVMAGVAYLAFYRGLQLGPIALVSPIGAGYGAVSVGLAAVFMRERLDPWSWFGVVAALVGIVLTARRPGAVLRTKGGRRGVPYALVAMLGFGVSAFVIGSASQRLGWTASILLARIGAFGLLLSLAANSWLRTPRGSTSCSRRLRDGTLAAAVGVIDVAAVSAFARASELGLVSVAAAVSATYPLVPVIVGVLRFGERLRPPQWVGTGLVVAGLVALGVSS